MRIFFLAVAAVLLFGVASQAAIVPVTTVVDENNHTIDPNVGAGTSLREAIIYSNEHSGIQTITFDESVFGTPQTIVLKYVLPVITRSVIINGPAAGVTVRQGSDRKFDFFSIKRLVKVTFSDMTILSMRGSAIVSSGELTVNNCSFSSSSGSDIVNYTGGTVSAFDCTFRGDQNGVANAGLGTFTRCKFSESYQGLWNLGGTAFVNNCMFNGRGVGIQNAGGTVTVTDCLISARRFGIENDVNGILTLSNCTLTANGVTAYGSAMEIIGGIVTATNCTIANNPRNGIVCFNDGKVTANNCTISGNVRHGVYNYGGSLTLNNCLVAGNGFNTQGVITSASHTVVTATAAAAGLEVDANGNPVLKNNGGPTETIALVNPAGLAVSAGSNALIPDGVTTDQRGVGHPRVLGGTVDTGAFESRFGSTNLSVNSPEITKEGPSFAPSSVTFTVTLSPASVQTVTVNYATRDGATNGAEAGTDYIAKAGTLTFAPGETAKNVTVGLIGDDKPEATEKFFLDLSTPINTTINIGRGTAYIRNDDGPSLSIANATTVNEGNSGMTSQHFSVSLNGLSVDTITVPYATFTNTAGTDDYVATSGVLTFAPFELSKTITVLVKGDTAVEGNEKYSVKLFSPSFATLSRGIATGYIRNDDAAAPLAPSE